jgi:hypothetical protein
VGLLSASTFNFNHERILSACAYAFAQSGLLTRANERRERSGDRASRRFGRGGSAYQRLQQSAD